MVKAKVTLSIDANTWEQFKRTYDNASQEIQELMISQLDISKIEDVDMIEERIKELEEERDELEDDIDKLQAQKEGVESELNTARATLEKLEREEANESDGLATFKENCSEGTFPDEWRKPDDIPSFWIDETGKNREELFEIYENGGEES